MLSSSTYDVIRVHWCPKPSSATVKLTSDDGSLPMTLHMLSTVDFRLQANSDTLPSHKTLFMSKLWYIFAGYQRGVFSACSNSTIWSSPIQVSLRAYLMIMHSTLISHILQHTPPYLKSLPSVDAVNALLIHAGFPGTDIYCATSDRRESWNAEWNQCLFFIYGVNADWAERYTWDLSINPPHFYLHFYLDILPCRPPQVFHSYFRA